MDNVGVSKQMSLRAQREVLERVLIEVLEVFKTACKLLISQDFICLLVIFPVLVLLNAKFKTEQHRMVWKGP